MNLDELSLDPELQRRATVAGAATDVWPILVDRKRGLVAVRPDGLYLFLPDGVDVRHLWRELTDVEIGEYNLRPVTDGASEPATYALEHRLHGRAIRAAIEGAGGRVSATGAAASGSTPGVADRPTPAARTASASPSAEASQQLKNLFAAGVVIQVIGGIIIGTAWPRTDIDLITGSPTDHGSSTGVLVGFAIAWAGAVMIGVAVIGWGVMLGNRASDDRSA